LLFVDGGVFDVILKGGDVKHVATANLFDALDSYRLAHVYPMVPLRQPRPTVISAIFSKWNDVFQMLHDTPLLVKREGI